MGVGPSSCCKGDGNIESNNEEAMRDGELSPITKNANLMNENVKGLSQLRDSGIDLPSPPKTSFAQTPSDSPQKGGKSLLNIARIDNIEGRMNGATGLQYLIQSRRERNAFTPPSPRDGKTFTQSLVESKDIKDPSLSR
jgi:hypothetical protein